jgi:hypothetical protein
MDERVAIGVGYTARVYVNMSGSQIHREFDYYDILANVLGSGLALALCNWYHKRMVERKRAARGYAAIAGDDNEDRDIELGESVDGQVSGVVRPTVEEELDTWDENAEDDDWDVADGGDMGNPPVQDGGDLGVADSKKRAD